MFGHFFNTYISFNFEDIDYVHNSFDCVFIPNCEAIFSTFKFHCHSNFIVVEVKPFIISTIVVGVVTKVDVVKGSID